MAGTMERGAGVAQPVGLAGGPPSAARGAAPKADLKTRFTDGLDPNVVANERRPPRIGARGEVQSVGGFLDDAPRIEGALDELGRIATLLGKAR